MKILLLLLFTLYLISGPVSCFKVTGYLGGSVILASDLRWSLTLTKFIYKLESNTCINRIPPVTVDYCVYDQRFTLYESKAGRMMVWIRGLNLQDAGVYRIGVGNLFGDIWLKIVSNSCCGRSETLSVSQGETVNISCRYPDHFQNHYKHFCKLEDRSFKEILNTGTETQRDRFSISDDKVSRDVSLRISDVRNVDQGVYSCAAWTTVGSVGYYSLFSEIQLQVTARPSTAPPTAEVIITDEESSRSFIIIITVSICVVLLLIGGLTLIFYCMLRKKRQDSTDESSGVELKDNKQVPPVVCVYEEIKPTKHLPDSDTGVYANASTKAPPKDQELTYSILTPPKDQDLTYSTVSFHKNSGSSTDASVIFNKKETETEYASIKRPKELE